MRVLHIIPSVGSVRGGPSLAALAMVKALQSLGIEAEIATTNDNGTGLLNVSLQECIKYEQVPVWFFSRFSPNIHFIREYAFSSHLTTWLWHNIYNYDLLHIHAIFSYPSTIAMAIARLKKVPYIVQPHGLLCEWSLQQKSLKKQIYLKLIEKANLNSSQALHFTTRQEQKEVSLLGLKAPSFILPLGISPSIPIENASDHLRQLLNIPTNEPVILFLSRLHPKKGLDYLIPALSKLHHPFTFILAGSGNPEYEEQIKSLIDSAGLFDRTRLVGFVEGEFKEALIQGSDLFVLTSYSENFGIVVLEALVAGLPLLITTGVALAPIVKHYQVGFVTELDISAIACALNEFLTDIQTAKNMGERGRQLVFEKYTWEQIALRMQQIYTSILQQKTMVIQKNSKQELK
jgi:glycosyltransferase involved in cell wall biosynthesis